MSEIGIKSPEVKDRIISTVSIPMTVTINGACCSTTDIGGVTLAAAGTTACCGTPTITFSGLECVLGKALDSSREAGIRILQLGTVAGATGAEAGQIFVTNSTVAGAAGSRTLAYALDTGGTALNLGTDSFTNAVVELVIPVKNADF